MDIFIRSRGSERDPKDKKLPQQTKKPRETRILLLYEREEILVGLFFLFVRKKNKSSNGKEVDRVAGV